MDERRSALAYRFRQFGERECVPASPLYARLALGVAEDNDLLELAMEARAHPVPNLLFAAVHYLLLRGAKHPLGMFYPAVTKEPLDIAHHDPVPAFRAFCHEHREAIAALLATRRVQTNEVRRCACLLPAFSTALDDGRPLAFVEIGTSAGLNLLWDRYHYDYGVQTWGDAASPVHLRCDLRGDAVPPLFATVPEIVYRVGLDLAPIDVRDEDQALWLRALIWPEQRDRAWFLEHAFVLAQHEPPTLLAGDANALLPDVLAGAPLDASLCLVHSFVLNQFDPAARERLDAILAAHAAQRDFAVVGMEWLEPPAPRLSLTTYRSGERMERTLARCDAHGGWLEWGRNDLD